MKKAALFISLVMAILSASSCSRSKSGNIIVPDTPEVVTEETVPDETEDEEEIEILDPTEGTAFKKGKIEGNVYTSEFAGIKFTLPDELSFMAQEDLDNMFEQALKMTSGEDRRRIMTKITEAEVIHPATRTMLDISYYNLSQLCPDKLDMTEKDFFINEIIPFVGNMGVKVTDPMTVDLGGREFTMVIIGDIKKTAPREYLYVSRIDNDFIIFITACPGDFCSQEEFESWFEKAE